MELKVGMKVECNKYGRGVVERTTYNETIFAVNFPDYGDWWNYNHDGTFNGDIGGEDLWLREVVEEEEQPILQFREDLLTNENLCVHCDTEEKALALLAWADSKGKKWSIGASFLDSTNYGCYKENTTYIISTGKYADLEWASLRGFTVISYEDALISSTLTNGIEGEMGKENITERVEIIQTFTHIPSREMGSICARLAGSTFNVVCEPSPDYEYFNITARMYRDEL
jgi:hypothetical protein